jgi:hypothetical protein
VSEYRLNIMDRERRVALSLAFTCQGDEEALRIAAIEAEGCDAELWRQARIVGKLYAQAPAYLPSGLAMGVPFSSIFFGRPSGPR